MADAKKPLQTLNTKPVEAGVGGVRKVVAEAIAAGVKKLSEKEAAKVGARTFNKVVEKTPEPNINTAGGAKTTRTSGSVTVKTKEGSTSTAPNAKSVTVNKPPLTEAQAENIRGMHYAKIANEASKAGTSAAESAAPEIAKAKIGTAVKTAAVTIPVTAAVVKGTQADHHVTDNKNHTRTVK